MPLVDGLVCGCGVVKDDGGVIEDCSGIGVGIPAIGPTSILP